MFLWAPFSSKQKDARNFAVVIVVQLDPKSEFE